MKKRILFLGDLGGGGKERRMSELIRYLSEGGGYDIFLMLNKDIRRDYPQTLNFVTGYREIDFNCGIWNRIKQVGDYVKEVRPDIVHSWHEYFSLYIDLQKPLLPHFYYIAGFVADANPDGFLRGLADKLTYMLSDKVISNSKAGLIAHHVPIKKSTVIYNGFNEDRIPKEDKREETRKSLGLVQESVVMMAGRMQRGKDYNTFIDAIKLLNNKVNNVKYLFVGHGEYEERYKARVKSEEIENIIFTGFRKDIEYIFQIAELSVLCTDEFHNEGVSNVIMESMAMGLPVIATRSGGTPEIVTDGENGYLISVGDANTLATRIEKILKSDELRMKFSDKAKETVRGRFSIGKMVGDYINVYQKADGE